MLGNQNTTELKKEIPYQELYNDTICFSCELIVKPYENGKLMNVA